jgi:hypothetical protein
MDGQFQVLVEDSGGWGGIRRTLLVSAARGFVVQPQVQPTSPQRDVEADSRGGIGIVSPRWLLAERRGTEGRPAVEGREATDLSGLDYVGRVIRPLARSDLPTAADGPRAAMDNAITLQAMGRSGRQGGKKRVRPVLQWNGSKLAVVTIVTGRLQWLVVLDMSLPGARSS